MMLIRKSNQRGYFDHGWLKTFHTFSFADYYDPKMMGFGSLRVINDDRIEAGAGFPTHGHKDMEILTYPLDGAVAHKDSTGGDGLIHPGEVQMMTAGKGIRHSEFNHYKDRETHLYQIWILPDGENLKPEYRQKDFSSLLNKGEPVLLASPDKSDGALEIHQDIKIWGRRFQEKKSWSYTSDPSRVYWLQVVKGTATLNGNDLAMGDGVGFGKENKVEIIGQPGTEVLFFDMKP